MSYFLTVLNVLGALGVFLFGMKVMSEALQKVAGGRLQALLDGLTRNRVSGVITGFLMTTLVQSSSATTVMVISFVGAGLLSLTSAIAVIMGANIGTTVTGWLVALLGFKVKITAFALPALAAGMGLSFIRAPKVKQWGEVFLGFGLLFLGLSLMKDAVPTMTGDQLSWMSSMASYGLASTVFFVGVGTLLTIILQSSSATMTLTLTLTAAGVIPYEVAAAMILGENVGTTATANLAAIGGSSAARRAARAHFIFNVFGVIWATVLLHIALLPLVDMIVPGDPAALSAIVLTSHLAALHTLFNITNTIIMLPFVKQLAGLVTRWVPEEVPDKWKFTRFPSTGVVNTPELFIVLATEEMRAMSDIATELYGDALRLLGNPHQSLGSLVEDTALREEKLDGLEREILDALALTARSATSVAITQQIGEMSQNTHRLERIGDHCEKLVEIAIRNHQAGEKGMSESAIEDIMELGALVKLSLEQLGEYISGDGTAEEAIEIENQIDAMRDKLRIRYIKRIRKGKVRPVPVLWLLEAIGHLEEIGDRVHGLIMSTEATRKL